MHSYYLQLGHLHIPIFGVFAALGLMAALAQSQWTARSAGLASEAVWNAGVTATLAAFVISRLLLILFNLHSFLQYPLLVFALPSLTFTGILLTALFMMGYIRSHKLPPLPLIDAVIPCAALLFAFLNIGRVFDGTRDGMPTSLPWGVHEAMTGAVHPVEMYSVIASSLIYFLLLCLLHMQHVAGKPGAIGLLCSGVAIFFLDFFRLPSELLATSWLDPSQIMGIAMILVGAALFMRVRTQVKRESGNEPPHAI